MGCPCSSQVQLICIQLRVPEYGWPTQKVFHLMNFVVTGLRAALFGFYRNVYTIKPQVRSLLSDMLRPVYYIINEEIYLVQACIWISIRLSQGHMAWQLKLPDSFFQVIVVSLVKSPYHRSSYNPQDNLAEREPQFGCTNYKFASISLFVELAQKYSFFSV